MVKTVTMNSLTQLPTKEEIYALLQGIPDPEIPVISIIELGILQGVEIKRDHVEVLITPTYSACPALFTIKEDVEKLLSENNIPAEVKIVYSPAWTTDFITREGREKLLAYGITPPEAGEKADLSKTGKMCPRCYSRNTVEISRFGSTLCKASYQCKDCLEPFDYFKCH